MKPNPLLPAPEAIQRLAVNDNGFVFDPVTGRSFTVNASGLALLRLMAREQDVQSIVERLTESWDVEPRVAERDLIEFAAELRKGLGV